MLIGLVRLNGIFWIFLFLYDPSSTMFVTSVIDLLADLSGLCIMSFHLASWPHYDVGLVTFP